MFISCFLVFHSRLITLLHGFFLFSSLILILISRFLLEKQLQQKNGLFHWFVSANYFLFVFYLFFYGHIFFNFVLMLFIFYDLCYLQIPLLFCCLYVLCIHVLLFYVVVIIFRPFPLKPMLLMMAVCLEKILQRFMCFLTWFCLFAFGFFPVCK